MKYRVNTKTGEAVIVDGILNALNLFDDCVEALNKCKTSDERVTARLTLIDDLITSGAIEPYAVPNEGEFVDAIKDYANHSHAYLECRTDYGKGYRDGVTQCKTTILELLKYFGLNDNE